MFQATSLISVVDNQFKFGNIGKTIKLLTKIFNDIKN
jgi:hypothetical protein